jgi:hypothetical protein
MRALSFYLEVIQALEEIEAPYMIVGAFAGLAFGVTRATFDVDILVDLREGDFEALAAYFPPVLSSESSKPGTRGVLPNIPPIFTRCWYLRSVA